MENNFEILLAGMLDEQKTLSNINTGITNLQKKLKEINISLNIGNIDKQVEQISKSFNKLNNSSIVKSNPMSKYQQAIEDTVHKYKTGLLDLETYSKRMQSLIFGKNSSTYKSDFTNLSNGSQEKYIAALNQAYSLQGKTLNEVYNTTKKIQTEEEKRASAVNNQTVAIQKMQNALAYSTNKYSSGVDQTALSNLQSQLSALSQLNPQTNEYAIALKNAQLAVGEFNKQLAASVTSENAQSKAVTNQIVAIDRLKTSLSQMSSQYGSFVDSTKLNGIKQSISELEKMNPTSVAYANKLKLIQNETRKLGTESKNAFRAAQDGISDTTAKATSLGLAFRTLSQFFLIGSPIMLARKAFTELTSTINDANKAITDIRIVTGMSEASADSLLTTYNELGKSIGATTTQILEGSTEWFRAGKTVSEVQELVQASIIGSKMAGIESAQMTEYLTSALNGYKLEASDAMNVIDKMVGIDNKASTSLNELATAMSYTANTARNAGVDMDTLLSYLGTVSEASRQSAETVGTAFKTIFTRYGDIKLNKLNEDGIVTSDVIKTFDTLGIKVKENETTWRDFSDVIDELAGKWSGLSEAEQNAASKALAGTRQREMFLALMENYGRSTELATVAIESNGLALDRYNNIYLESTAAKLDKLKATIEGVFLKTLTSNTMNLFIDATTGVIGFIDACGGLIPVIVGVTTAIVALRTAIKLIEFGNTVGGIKSVSDALVAYQMMTETATAATVGLSMAQKLLIGGGIVAAVMAIGYGINYFSTSSQRAKENVSKLTSELNEIKKTSTSLEGLASEFEELSKKTNLNSEESKRLYEVQNQIKELQPEIGGYYDENGNFIISQVSSAQELLEVQKQILQTKRDELALESKKTLNDDISKYEKQKDILENIAKHQEDIARFKELSAKGKQGELDSNESVEMQGISDRLIANNIIPSEIDKIVKDAKQQMTQAAGEINSSIINMLTADSAWDSLSDEAANGIRKTLSEMDTNQLSSYASKLKNGQLSAEGFIQVLRVASPVISSVSNAMDGAESSSQSYDETLKSLSERAKESAEKLDILKVAQAELLEKNDISGETMDKLIKKYPELEDEITNVEGAYSLLSKKIAENNFDKATQDVGDLTSILEDLEAGNGITSSSFKKLSSSFPELLKYMNDEHDLANAITEKMNELKDTQTEAYKQMLMSSQEYFKSSVLGNQQMATSMQNSIQSLFKTYGLLYNGDLKNWKSLADGKADIEKQLINGLGQAWEEHFKFLSNAFSKSATGSIMETSTFDRDSYAKLNLLNPVLDKSKLDAAEKMFNEQQKQYTKLQEQKSQAMRNASAIFDGITFDPIDIKVGGTKASSKSKTDDAFQKAIDRIKQAREEIEREIDLLQEKMNLAELTGDTKAFDDYANKMTVLLTKLKGVSAQEVSGYEELLKKFTKEDEQLELNQLIMESNTKKYSDEQTYINQSIDLINRKYDLEKRVYDDKLRQLNIEQSLMKENGEAYQQAEQEKINLLLSNQSSYMQKVKQLREMGFSDQQEEVRKYIDLWYDAKEEILTIEKSLAEQRKSIFKETLQNQQTQTENLIDMTMDMLRDRYNEEKKLIEENAQAEEDALKAKLDGYRKIIEAKKKELQDEASEEDYNDGLKEKQKEIADLKNQASLLSMDETSKDKYEKLLEEIASKEKELKKYQRDYNLNIQQETLDKELEQYEENINSQIDAVEKQKDSELDIIEKSLNNEVKLRAEAIKLIESKNKDLYNKLLAWSEEYGTKTKDEITEAWEGANSALETYGGTAQSVLDTLKLMAEKMKEIDNSNWTDWTNGSGNVNSNDFASSSGSSSSSSLSSKAKEQLNQQKYLHDQMVIANETNNEGLKKWVQEQRKKYGLDPKTGAIVKQWHTGINNGRIDGLKADETILKALNNEWIITNDQYNNLKKNLDGISSRNSGGNITIEVGSLMNGVTIEKGVDEVALGKKLSNSFFDNISNKFKMRGIKI